MKRLLFFTPFIIIMQLAANKVNAQGKIYLKLDSIVGTSTTPGADSKKNLIDVLAVSTGASNELNIGSSGPGAGRVQPQTINFNLTGFDELNDFKRLFVKGTIIPKGWVFFTLDGAPPTKTNDYYVIALGDIIIAGIDEASGGGFPPGIQVSLAYGKATYFYRKKNTSGVLQPETSSSWNYELNTQANGLVMPDKF